MPKKMKLGGVADSVVGTSRTSEVAENCCASDFSNIQCTELTDIVEFITIYDGSTGEHDSKFSLRMGEVSCSTAVLVYPTVSLIPRRVHTHAPKFPEILGICVLSY